MIRRFSRKKHLLAGVTVLALTGIIALAASATNNGNGFIQGIVVPLDGVDYYLAGPPDGSNDIPGHYWNQAGPKKLVGKHYNSGPLFGEGGSPLPQWWSSDAPDGELLYKVQGIIDTWSEAKAERYAAKGYVHYHEFVSVADASLHPTKVLWLKHIARTSFTLDGGPAPALGHAVTPGVDYEFINNYFVPYDPED